MFSEPINFIKVKPRRWWSPRNRKLAKTLTNFDNYLLTKICDEKGIAWLMKNQTTEEIKQILKEIKKK